MDALCERMECDRLIKVYVGEQTSVESKPFLIQATLLETASEWFVKALKHEHLGGEPGVLRLPEDDLDAWKVFIHWLVMKKLPQDHMSNLHDQYDHAALVRCWVIGDKYGISEFQNLIMLDLLDSLEDCCVQTEAARLGFECTAPGSVMRELMAAEVAECIENRECVIHARDLETLDDVGGVFSAVAAVLARSARDEGVPKCTPRVPVYEYEEGAPRCIHDPDSEVWEPFMVADGLPVEMVQHIAVNLWLPRKYSNRGTAVARSGQR